MIPDFGAHAVFVWASYGIVAVGLIGLVISTLREARHTQTAIDRIKRRRATAQMSGTAHKSS